MLMPSPKLPGMICPSPRGFQGFILTQPLTPSKHRDVKGQVNCQYPTRPQAMLRTIPTNLHHTVLFACSGKCATHAGILCRRSRAQAPTWQHPPLTLTLNPHSPLSQARCKNGSRLCKMQFFFVCGEVCAFHMDLFSTRPWARTPHLPLSQVCLLALRLQIRRPHAGRRAHAAGHAHACGSGDATRRHVRPLRHAAGASQAKPGQHWGPSGACGVQPCMAASPPPTVVGHCLWQCF